MWDNRVVKAAGLVRMKANYWRCVLVSIILGIAAGATSGGASSSTSSQTTQAMSSGEADALAQYMPIILGTLAVACLIAIAIQILVANPLMIGCQKFFLKNREEQPEVGVIGHFFKNGYKNVVLTVLLMDVYLCLWSCLFVIPGIIKSYSYRMVPYIIAEHPEMSPNEAITLSRQMMDGKKWKSFVFDLSFIGWFLLAIITCGIVGIFYTNPYYFAANAELYATIRDQYNGTTTVNA